ncbi:DASS family sodium-coupled anion symporter [bacterium]|nr:DASS family sodium-coupled anion symporter [bacterium]
METAIKKPSISGPGLKKQGVVVLQSFLAIDWAQVPTSPEVLNTFFKPFGSAVIMLFFGGFIIARALQIHDVAKFAAIKLLSVVRPAPKPLLISVMGITAFISLWLSNTATTVMVLAIAMPILSGVGHDNPYKKALGLAIPFAASIGGMGTPVGTPPNAIAIGLLSQKGVHISFFKWMLCGVPIVLILLTITFFILIWLFPSTESRFQFDLGELPNLTTKSILSAGIALASVVLWMTTPLHHLTEALIAVIAATALILTGCIKSDDVHAIEWQIMILMWGGLVLGQGMETSGLTAWISNLKMLHVDGGHMVILFVLVSVGLSTFLNDTATANLLLPIAIGLAGTQASAVGFATAVSSSIALSLPISCAPNAVLFSRNFIRAREFFIAGALVTMAGVLAIFASYWLIILPFGWM